MNIVSLPLRHDCHDMAAVLRNIADDIENGAYDFAPTMGVLVIGTETERATKDGPVVSFNWQTHGLGNCGHFAAKGLLACAVNSFESNDG